MAAIGELFGKLPLGLGGGGFLSTAITIIIGAAVLCICGFGLWYWIRKKKNWNLKVEFKIPRNIQLIKEKNGQMRVIGTLNKEWGKGNYNVSKGIVSIQRKGKKPSVMKPFDIKRYLSSNNILTVMQVGIDDYRPVLDDSYIEVVDDETGEEAALIKARIDTSESKSWKNTFERESKQAYSIKNWLAEHGGIVAMGIVLMMNLVGFAIVISRMPK